MSSIHLRIASMLTCCVVAFGGACVPASAAMPHPAHGHTRMHADSGNHGSNLGQVDMGRDASDRGDEGPIVYATGNLIVPQGDFQSQGEMGLFLKRSFNNYWSGIGIFGAKWQSNFDYKLSFNTSSSTDPCYPKPGGVCTTVPTGTMPLWAHLPDGRRVEYIYNASLRLWQEDKPSPISTIVRNADGTYTLTNSHHGIERYSATGYMLSIADEYGVGWTFSYNASNYLQTVTHTSGRTVQFIWTGNKLTAVTDPAGNVHTYTYLANQLGTGLNVLSTAVVTNQVGGTPGTTKYFYEDSRYPGGLTGISYNNTRYSTYAYDANSYAVSMSHGAAGTYDHFTYAYTPGSNGALTVVESSPLGRQTTYNFNNGLLASASATGGANVDNASKTHTYDANGYDAKVTDYNGNVTSYTYAANGQLQQVVEGYGTPVARTTQYVWDTDVTRNRLVKVVVVGYRETDYAYDPVTQRLSSVNVKNLTTNGVANQAQTTTYTYTTTSNGMVIKLVVERAAIGTSDDVTYLYDNYGNLSSFSNSLGQTVTYSNYDGLGNTGQVVGINGDTTQYTYNARGQVVTVQTYPNGVAATRTYGYDATGQMTSLTTPDGMVENYIYDDTRTLIAKSRKVASGMLVDNATQEKETYSYDANHDLLETDDYAVAGSTSTLTRRAVASYDGLGRLWVAGGNNGQNFITNYDFDGNAVTKTDSLNHVTKFYYDALNRVTNEVDAKNGVTTFVHDPGNKIVSVTDPRNLVTTYIYDGFGQVWAQSSPDSGTVSVTYDTAGRRTKLTRADGTASIYSYDGLSRVTSVAPQYGVGGSQTFTYDTCTNGKGRLCSVGSTSSLDPYSLTTTYTPEGLVASQSSTLFNSTQKLSYKGSLTTAYSYDSMGNVTGVTYPNGQVASYAYVSGKLSSLKVTIGGVVSNVATGLSYEPYASPAGWTYGNGLVRGNNYDLDGRLTGLSTSIPSSTVLQSLTFGFDANNHITAITNGTNASLTQSYGYDELTRLATVTSTSGNGSWGYDANGNRTTQGTTTDGIDTASNRLMSVGSRAFTYDENGNRLTDSNSVGGGTAQFWYDNFNRMNQSIANGVTTSYVVDPLGRRVYKSNPSGAYFFTYSSDGALISEAAYSNSSGSLMQTTNYLRMGGTVVGMVRNNTLYMIHTDQLGRPEIVTNGAKTIVWRANNFAFDRTVTLDSIGGLNLGFPGQYYDAETNLWNNGFRDYDATVGRYIESDPLGLSAGINTYVYVNGNPVSATDQLGLSAGGAAIGGVVGGIAGQEGGGEAGAWVGGVIGEVLFPPFGGVAGSIIGSWVGQRYGSTIGGAVGAYLGDVFTNSPTPSTSAPATGGQQWYEVWDSSGVLVEAFLGTPNGDGTYTEPDGTIITPNGTAIPAPPDPNSAGSSSGDNGDGNGDSGGAGGDGSDGSGDGGIADEGDDGGSDSDSSSGPVCIDYSDCDVQPS